MRRKWLIILATIHVSECVLTLTVTCVLPCLNADQGLIWMSICLTWWLLSGLTVNGFFWYAARKAGITHRLTTASHCMLGGVLWRLYLLKDIVPHVTQDDDDETHKRNSVLRLEVITLKTCLSFLQTYPVLFMCTRYSTSSYFSLSIGLLISLSVVVVVSSTCFCIVIYVGDCVDDFKPNYLSVLEPSITATNFDPASPSRLLALIRSLSITQSTAFQIGRLVTATSLSMLLGITLFFPVLLIRLGLAFYYLAKDMYAELALTSWDLRRHRTAIGRLIYLSYLTLFDWYVNRDNKRGTSLIPNAKTKHAVVYYAWSAIESVVVTVLWSLTSCSNVQEELWFQGAHFASIGIGCNLASAILILVTLLLLHWEKTRVIPRIETCNCDGRPTELMGISNPAMDYTENGVRLVPEPNPKNASSYVDFKDLDDDEVVLFVAEPSSSGIVPSAASSMKELPSSSTSPRPSPSPIPQRLIKRTQPAKISSRSCKMGLHSLLLRRDSNFPKIVAPVEDKNQLMERRKSLDIITTMVSREEFGLVEERMPFDGSLLSVDSLNAPYARSIRTMSWPIIAPTATVFPIKWEGESVESKIEGSSESPRFEIPQITCDGTEDSQDVYYV